VTDGLLERVIDQYLSSRDFNGLYVSAEDRKTISPAIALVKQGLIEVVTEEDFPNPHIRPWPSKRGVDEQIESLERLRNQAYGLCLYPTAAALADIPLPDGYEEQPHRAAMARGRGSLELAYFDFHVLEQYRNDPRFRFEFYDFGARTVISDAAYEDATEPEHDKVLMDHIGFGYDLTNYAHDDPNSRLIRYVCAFYGDLADLSPRHQQRWRTYEVPDATELRPHPVWWAQQGGHWPDGIGPFERVLHEMTALNELNERAFGEPLLETTIRPREFGWLLRASQQEWDTFISVLDKLLSENLRHSALDKLGAPRELDGQRIGTITRLEVALIARGISEKAARGVLAPLREVRSARQKPAHQLRTNITDATFVRKQVELLSEVGNSIETLRVFWQRHPDNADWEEPDYLAEDFRRYRL